MDTADPPLATAASNEARAPRVASSTELLARIEQRLARLEARTEWFAQAHATAPKLVATAGDLLDAFADRHDLNARAEHASILVEQLTRPETLEQLSQVLAIAQALPKLAATVGDTLDGYADRAEKHGVELDSLVPRLAKMSTRVATALQAADRSEPAPKGVFALLRELKDPDIRHALGFIFAFAKQFGRSGDRHQPLLPSASRERTGSDHGTPL